jgi:hypothetical protein
LFNKTPSRLAYARGTSNVKSWGVFVEVGESSTELREYFKLHLDPDYHEFRDNIPQEDAVRYYRDYLSCVHGHIARFFQKTSPRWTEMRVEWDFSVPTTWKNAGMIRELTSIMREAGFGRDGPHHSCMVTLTEAEAAAVSAARQPFVGSSVSFAALCPD